MHRSSSNTRVADDFYKSSSSSSSPPHAPAIDGGAGGGNCQLPVYNPTSDAGKKERLRLRSVENAVHLIPVVLVLCAFILWFFSSPVDIVNRSGPYIANTEGLKAVGAADVDGTQNSLLPHLEQLEDAGSNEPVRDTKPSR